MQSYPRMNTYHSPKQRLLGNPAAQPAPAWRTNAKNAQNANTDVGSKILLSRLPADVVENEVETLFSRTVGPVKEVLMVYNDQGKSRGMAVVTFARAGDAALARSKYNGKIVDGRRPIRIEIVVDEDNVPKAPASNTVVGPPSLLSRIGPSIFGSAHSNTAQGNTIKIEPIVVSMQVDTPIPVTKVRLRKKRGPRRLNKQRGLQQAQTRQSKQQKQKPKTLAELDADMDNYRASAK